MVLEDASFRDDVILEVGARFAKFKDDGDANGEVNDVNDVNDANGEANDDANDDANGEANDANGANDADDANGEVNDADDDAASVHDVILWANDDVLAGFLFLSELNV